MPRPEWLEEAKQRNRLEAKLHKCINCDHLGSPFKTVKIGSKKHYIYKCNKHNCEVGVSSYSCDDWTQLTRERSDIPS